MVLHLKDMIIPLSPMLANVWQGLYVFCLLFCLVFRLLEDSAEPLGTQTRFTLLIQAVEDCFIGRHFIFGIKVHWKHVVWCVFFVSFLSGIYLNVFWCHLIALCAQDLEERKPYSQWAVTVKLYSPQKGLVITCICLSLTALSSDVDWFLQMSWQSANNLRYRLSKSIGMKRAPTHSNLCNCCLCIFICKLSVRDLHASPKLLSCSDLSVWMLLSSRLNSFLFKLQHLS